MTAVKAVTASRPSGDLWRRLGIPRSEMERIVVAVIELTDVADERFTERRLGERRVGERDVIAADIFCGMPPRQERRTAHLAWDVEKRPVFYPTSVPLEAVKIPGFVALVRLSGP